MKQPYGPLAGLALCVLAWAWWEPAATAREWTDASGVQHVQAEFLTLQFGKVWLLRNDGGVFGVSEDELSTGDRQYVQQVVRQRQQDRQATLNPPGRVAYGEGRQRCTLANAAISESSGLASSRRHAGFFWTHDSGDEARVYLFDLDGTDRGSCLLKDTLAYDFEDLCSVVLDGRPLIVLGDVGNNGRAAPVQMLHVIEEPAFDPRQGVLDEQLPVVQTIYYSYEDDHRDCEALAVDPPSRTILMISRESANVCYVYALPWPEPDPRKAFSARRIAQLALPPVTALDLSPDGRRAIVLTYRDAYEFVRSDGQEWSQAFAGPPRRISVPERVQGESICYGYDGRTLYLTSEKRPTPLIEVPVLAPPAPEQP